MAEQKRPRSLSILSIALLAVVALAGMLLPSRAVTKEQELATVKLPENIRQALGDVDIEGVERETRNGTTTYEVDIEEDGVEFELTLDAEGRLLNVKVEDADDDEEVDEDEDEDQSVGDNDEADDNQDKDGDDEHSHQEHSAAEAKTRIVDFSTLPKAAQMVFSKEAGKATIEKVEREEIHGRVIFEAMWNIGGLKHEATVTADGVIVNLEKDAAAETVPVDVRRAAEKAFAGLGKISYERKLLVVFEAEAGAGEQKEEFLLSPLGIQVELEEQQE